MTEDVLQPMDKVGLLEASDTKGHMLRLFVRKSSMLLLDQPTGPVANLHGDEPTSIVMPPLLCPNVM